MNPAVSAVVKGLAVSGSLDGTVRLWDVQTGAELAVREERPDAVEAVAVTPDGQCVVSAGMNDGRWRMWSTRTREPQGEIEGDFNAASSLVISPDGRFAVAR